MKALGAPDGKKIDENSRGCPGGGVQGQTDLADARVFKQRKQSLKDPGKNVAMMVAVKKLGVNPVPSEDLKLTEKFSSNFRSFEAPDRCGEPEA